MKMRKILTIILVLTALLALAGVTAYAYDYEVVGIEVPFEVKEGGTVQIIPEVNSPVPGEAEMTVADGETGRFHIDFDTVGEYSYTVKMKPSADGTETDDTVYQVKVYINDEDGVLSPTFIAYKGNEKYTGHGDFTGAPPDKCLYFVMAAHYEPPTEPPTEPPPDTPSTGDDTHMERNFLIAIIASAGLLTLSIVYYNDTKKLLKEKDKEA